MWDNVKDSIKGADVHIEKNEYNKINMYKTYKSIAGALMKLQCCNYLSKQADGRTENKLIYQVNNLQKRQKVGGKTDILNGTIQL